MRHLLATLVLTGTLHGVAMAETRDRQIARCVSYDTDPDLAIVSCSALLGTGQEPDPVMAQLFYNRANAYEKKVSSNVRFRTIIWPSA